MLASSVVDLQLRALKASVPVKGREMGLGLSLFVDGVNECLLHNCLVSSLSHELLHELLLNPTERPVKDWYLPV